MNQFECHGPATGWTFWYQSGRPFGIVVRYVPAKRALFSVFELVCAGVAGGLGWVLGPLSMEDEVRFLFPFHCVSYA